VTVSLPKRLAEELEKRGVDVEPLLIDFLVKELNLDPRVGVEAHLELASKYLEEGRGLVDKDPVQASEKLYKAAEEAVKALAFHFDVREVLDVVEKRGRWSAAELARAVMKISKRLERWFRYSWDSAWVLHVWGFHEAKLSLEDVKERLPDVERLVSEARRVVEGR
jgi:hypothetical protein